MPPDEQRGQVVTVSLSSDELRLIFAQLLTTRNCEKDFGRCASGASPVCGFAACGLGAENTATRKLTLGSFLTARRFAAFCSCLCVSKEWAEVLENTPRRVRELQSSDAEGSVGGCSCGTALTRPFTARSLWFKLFQMLDPQEAARAAAVAPAPAPVRVASVCLSTGPPTHLRASRRACWPSRARTSSTTTTSSAAGWSSTVRLRVPLGHFAPSPLCPFVRVLKRCRPRRLAQDAAVLTLLRSLAQRAHPRLEGPPLQLLHRYVHPQQECVCAARLAFESAC